jgi:hypothetical protein
MCMLAAVISNKAGVLFVPVPHYQSPFGILHQSKRERAIMLLTIIFFMFAHLLLSLAQELRSIGLIT